MKDFGHYSKHGKEHANLPTEVHIKDYPSQRGVDGELDDTITGIDETVTHSKHQTLKHISNQH